MLNIKEVLLRFRREVIVKVTSCFIAKRFKALGEELSSR